ncbi:MAG: sigma-E processing peptidase SpoIIGA [Ruminococcus sp.]|nr:sigma-E processing peptidase SpoIIGA [Ruminococcus sp.]
MQIIYIDTLICVNLFIDYMILLLIRKVLHINTKSIRIILGSLFAGISTVGVFAPCYTVVFSIIYRLLTAGVTILIAYGYQSINKLCIRTLSYIGVSMLLCGGVIIIETIWNPTGVAVYNDSLYFDISPTLLIVTTTVVFFILSIYKRISEKHKLRCDIRTVTVHIDNNTIITFDSAIDTGCNLKEPFSGLPVIIVEEALLDFDKIPIQRKRVIPFNTASGSDIIMGFKPDKIYIDRKEIYSGCYIGVCKDKLKGEIKSIMGTELSEAVI